MKRIIAYLLVFFGLLLYVLALDLLGFLSPWYMLEALGDQKVEGAYR